MKYTVTLILFGLVALAPSALAIYTGEETDDSSSAGVETRSSFSNTDGEVTIQATSIITVDGEEERIDVEESMESEGPIEVEVTSEATSGSGSAMPYPEEGGTNMPYPDEGGTNMPYPDEGGTNMPYPDENERGDVSDGPGEGVTGGGTADINIGIGELDDDGHKEWIIIESMSMGGGSEMNKADLIEAIATEEGDESEPEAAAVFVKYEGVDGESKDTSSGSKKKPKEIVVVGSNARSIDVLQVINFAHEETGEGQETAAAAPSTFLNVWANAAENKNAAPDSFFDIDVGVSNDDLQLQAVSVAQNHENIKEIKLEEKKVQVTFETRMKLLGFIGIDTERVVMVDPDAESRVKVKVPWWHIFAAEDVSAKKLQKEIEAELQKTIPAPATDSDDRPTEEVAFYYNKIQAQTLQTISNVSK